MAPRQPTVSAQEDTSLDKGLMFSSTPSSPTSPVSPLASPSSELNGSRKDNPSSSRSDAHADAEAAPRSRKNTWASLGSLGAVSSAASSTDDEEDDTADRGAFRRRRYSAATSYGAPFSVGSIGSARSAETAGTSASILGGADNEFSMSPTSFKSSRSRAEAVQMENGKGKGKGKAREHTRSLSFEAAGMITMAGDNTPGIDDEAGRAEEEVSESAATSQKANCEEGETASPPSPHSSGDAAENCEAAERGAPLMQRGAGAHVNAAAAPSSEGPFGQTQALPGVPDPGASARQGPHRSHRWILRAARDRARSLSTPSLNRVVQPLEPLRRAAKTSARTPQEADEPLSPNQQRRHAKATRGAFPLRLPSLPVGQNSPANLAAFGLTPSTMVTDAGQDTLSAQEDRSSSRQHSTFFAFPGGLSSGADSSSPRPRSFIFRPRSGTSSPLSSPTSRSPLFVRASNSGSALNFSISPAPSVVSARSADDERRSFARALRGRLGMGSRSSSRTNSSVRNTGGEAPAPDSRGRSDSDYTASTSATMASSSGALPSSGQRSSRASSASRPLSFLTRGAGDGDSDSGAGVGMSASSKIAYKLLRRKSGAPMQEVSGGDGSPAQADVRADSSSASEEKRSKEPAMKQGTSKAEPFTPPPPAFPSPASIDRKGKGRAFDFADDTVPVRPSLLRTAMSAPVAAVSSASDPTSASTSSAPLNYGPVDAGVKEGLEAIPQVEEETKPDLFTNMLPREVRLYILQWLVRLHEEEHDEAVATGKWKGAITKKARWRGKEAAVKELVRLSRVSTSFLSLCLDGQLWISLDASPFAFPSEDHASVPKSLLLRVASHAGPFIRTLDLRGMCNFTGKELELLVQECAGQETVSEPDEPQAESSTRESPLASTPLRQPFTSLRTINLEGTHSLTASSLKFLITRSPQLVNASFKGLKCFGNEAVSLLATTALDLERLEVSHSSVDADGLWRALREDDGKTLMDGRWKPLRLTNLKSLLASRLMMSHESEWIQFLSLLGQRCPELTSLDLSAAFGLTDDSIAAFVDVPLPASSAEHETDVVVLTSQQVGLDPASPTKYARRVTKLRNVCLSNCMRLTDKAASYLAHAVPKLETFELAGIGAAIKQAGLVRLFGTTPYIRKVDLEDAEIGDRTLSALTPPSTSDDVNPGRHRTLGIGRTVGAAVSAAAHAAAAAHSVTGPSAYTSSAAFSARGGTSDSGGSSSSSSNARSHLARPPGRASPRPSAVRRIVRMRREEPPHAGEYLTHLLISSCTGPSATAMLSLIRSCHRLVHLEIDGTKATDAVVQEFVKLSRRRRFDALTAAAAASAAGQSFSGGNNGPASPSPPSSPSSALATLRAQKRELDTMLLSVVDCRSIGRGVVNELAGSSSGGGQTRPRAGRRGWEWAWAGYMEEEEEQAGKELGECDEDKVVLHSFWSWQSVDSRNHALARLRARALRTTPAGNSTSHRASGGWMLGRARRRGNTFPPSSSPNASSDPSGGGAAARRSWVRTLASLGMPLSPSSSPSGGASATSGSGSGLGSGLGSASAAGSDSASGSGSRAGGSGGGNPSRAGREAGGDAGEGASTPRGSESPPDLDEYDGRSCLIA